ncbi:hypothetical protein GEU84_011615 [Fertoebacter nigrum]|uniref:Uncharacterized protein n=1 Tax=Fertoeibacter niger TaxID=2656921 RepID=A0A8X8KRC0_9RHOB|nr:hypothetical protein [Fertoeibacter niger]NUB45037.1 hypothetical protein [Fertoeibacter niger]
MKTYAKSDLVAELALEHEMTQVEARRVLDTALRLISMPWRALPLPWACRWSRCG